MLQLTRPEKCVSMTLCRELYWEKCFSYFISTKRFAGLIISSRNTTFPSKFISSYLKRTTFLVHLTQDSTPTHLKRSYCLLLSKRSREINSELSSLTSHLLSVLLSFQHTLADRAESLSWAFFLTLNSALLRSSRKTLNSRFQCQKALFSEVHATLVLGLLRENDEDEILSERRSELLMTQ